MRTQKKGFTILELLIVVAILAILAVIAVPQFIGAIDKSRNSRELAEINSVKKAVDIYYVEKGSYPTLQGVQPVYGNPCNIKFDELVPNYLNKMPHFSYWYVDNEGDIYHTKYSLGVMSGSTIHGLSTEYSYKVDGIDFTGTTVDLTGKVLSGTDENGNKLPDITVSFKGTLQDPNSPDYDANNPPEAKITMPTGDWVTTSSNIAWGYSESTDPDGDQIVKAEWQGMQNTYTTPGEYTVQLRVQDSKGAWSEWVSKTFTVYDAQEVYWKTGGLTYIHTMNGNYTGTEATISKSSGKWYWEITIDSCPSYGGIGIMTPGTGINNSFCFGNGSTQYAIRPTGSKINSYADQAYSPNPLKTGDILGFALNMDNRTIRAYLNGVDLGIMYSSIATPMTPAFGIYTGQLTANFGATPFKYSVPDGYAPYMFK